MKKYALFVGRFQPFHKGHMKVMMDMAEHAENILVGIGSSQYHDSFENPLTFEERKKIIELTLLESGSSLLDRVKIIAIPDIHDYPKWVRHVEGILHEHGYDAQNDDYLVFSGNPIVRDLFYEKGYDVMTMDIYEGINATSIRERIVDGKMDDLEISKKVLDFLKEIGLQSRLQRFLR